MKKGQTDDMYRQAEVKCGVSIPMEGHLHRYNLEPQWFTVYGTGGAAR